MYKNPLFPLHQQNISCNVIISPDYKKATPDAMHAHATQTHSRESKIAEAEPFSLPLLTPNPNLSLHPTPYNSVSIRKAQRTLMRR